MQTFGSRRRLKRLGIVLALLVAIALIANGYMQWRTNRQLTAVIGAVRAAGDPASIAELAPVPVPADENAAVLLDKLGPRLDEFSTEQEAWGNAPLGKDYYERGDRGEPATKEQIASIRGVLEKFSDLEPGLTAAAKCEKYAPTADFSLDYRKFLNELLAQRAVRVRTAARFLHWSSEVALADGKPNQAIEQSLELMRLARLYDAEPTLVQYLISIAVRGHACDILYDALAAGPTTPELHTIVDTELALHDSPQRFIHMLKSDRAYSLSVAAEVSSQNLAPDLPMPLYGSLVTWPMKRQFLGATEYLSKQVAIASNSWPEPNSEIGRLNGPFGTNFGKMADLLLPALQAAYSAESRCVGEMRALRIFNVLQQFAEENGREASGLDELKLPPASVVDPYSGQPLKLKHTEDGWIVYSVMQNGVDDGGDFIELKDYGVAPPRYRLTERQEPPQEENAGASDQ